MAAVKEMSVKESLQALWKLQKIHSKIDDITILKGELPMEVSDLEDEIVGLETRMHKLEAELKEIETDISGRKTTIGNAKTQIKKYETQQNAVKNSREFDALTKEIAARARVGRPRHQFSDVRGEYLKPLSDATHVGHPRTRNAFQFFLQRLRHHPPPHPHKNATSKPTRLVARASLHKSTA